MQRWSANSEKESALSTVVKPLPCSVRPWSMRLTQQLTFVMKFQYNQGIEVVPGVHDGIWTTNGSEDIISFREIRSLKTKGQFSVCTVYNLLPQGPVELWPTGGAPRMFVESGNKALEDGPWKTGAQPSRFMLKTHLWSMLKMINNQTGFPSFILKPCRELLHCPGVKMPCSHSRGCGFDPWSGNQDPTCCSTAKK